MIGRHLGMFVDRTEVTGKDGGAVEIAKLSVSERAARLAYPDGRGQKALMQLSPDDLALLDKLTDERRSSTGS